MTLAWFAPLLEHQSPLFNEFEVFIEKVQYHLWTFEQKKHI
jgi:hypothetical protein